MTQPVSVDAALMEQFEGQQVPLYEIDGEMYLAGEDLGRMLGLADPRNAVRKIYNRNKSELEPHSRATKLTARDGRPRITRLYSEVGCYLATMFARTRKAREVRLWLALMAQNIRKAAAAPRQEKSMPEQGKSVPDSWPNTWRESLERAYFQGFGQSVKMFMEIGAGKVNLARLLSVIRWRLMGFRSEEVAKLVGLSQVTVQKYERFLREHGMAFPRGSTAAFNLDATSIGAMLARGDKERTNLKPGPKLRRIK
ncbi:MAG: Bro-N domain-containing protein [Thermodesulfobacteriota bacterium]